MSRTCSRTIPHMAFATQSSCSPSRLVRPYQAYGGTSRQSHVRIVSFSFRTLLNTPCIMQCWCGAEGIDFKRHGKSTCDYTCSGEPSATCGGYLAFDLFGVPQVAPTPAPTPGPTKYAPSLGCYKDVRTSRVFTNMISSEEMTPLVRVEYRRRDYCTPLVLRLNAIHG